MRTYIVLFVVSVLLLSGCLSQQKVQIENLDENWESTNDYQWDNNKTYRYGVDYKSEKEESTTIDVYLRGTSNFTNQELIIDNYYVKGKTLVFKSSLSDRPQVGTKATQHPEKIVRAYLSTDINTIKHSFDNRGNVSVKLKDSK